MQDVIQDIYAPLLTSTGFVPEPDDRRFGPMGTCWRQAGPTGEGYYWTYGQKDLFDIKIHDFYFYEDMILEFSFPESLSVTYYESICAEELSPCRKILPGCVKSFIGGSAPYRIKVHKDVPIVSVGIEITPAYYEGYLREQYPGEYRSPLQAFRTVGQTECFPEMVRLLKQVRDYRGEGIAAKLFYEGQVAQAVSLIVERAGNEGKARQAMPDFSLSLADQERLRAVSDHIRANFFRQIPFPELERIAYMGRTKLKDAFRRMYGCTVTEYIRRCRMEEAETLLSSTDLPVGQVARRVGYQKASHFSGLFRRHTGLLPAQYRRAQAPRSIPSSSSPPCASR